MNGSERGATVGKKRREKKEDEEKEEEEEEEEEEVVMVVVVVVVQEMKKMKKRETKEAALCEELTFTIRNSSLSEKIERSLVENGRKLALLLYPTFAAYGIPSNWRHN
ncbi:hypothetical protein HZH68_010340 [Vespula germanica]|uniref:Uncharacterized protein n=1 Tax=Vespula germanica TaxID=30212 RepID=A0A834JTV6_VESGE|nr:hypothetical protein HZH68_010340 [Vespula germanica]